MKNIFTKIWEWFGRRKMDLPAPEDIEPKPEPRQLYGTDDIKCLEAPTSNVNREHPNYKKKWKPNSLGPKPPPDNRPTLHRNKRVLSNEIERIYTKDKNNFRKRRG